MPNRLRQAGLIIALSAGLVACDSGGAQPDPAALSGGRSAASESGSSSPGAGVPERPGVIPTHFYRVRRTEHSLSMRAPWVTAAGGSLVLALGADAGTENGPRKVLGGTGTSYGIAELNAVTGKQRDLGAIDFASLGGTRRRVLDFQYLPALQSGLGADEARLLAVLATSDEATNCRRTYLQEVTVDLTGAGSNELGRQWFAMPCIEPVNPPDGEITGPVLHQSGGRVVQVPEEDWVDPSTPEVFFSTGDFQVIKTASDEIPAETLRLMGSVLRISQTGVVDVVASGLRNPQGLVVADLDGRESLLSTDHGPRGGDELNLIEEGGRYGWPEETYGTVYGKDQPQHDPDVQGAHPEGVAPAFAWLPSIGPSAIMQIRGDSFGRWWGEGHGRTTADLLVSGMGEGSLYRLRWQEGAVRYVESIPFQDRVRSLAQTDDGLIVAGTDAGRVAVLSPVKAWSAETDGWE